MYIFVRAGNEIRTRVYSLEGYRSTTELCPQMCAYFTIFYDTLRRFLYFRKVLILPNQTFKKATFLKNNSIKKR